MSDTDRNNLIAAKLRELADLFHGVATGAGPAPAAPPAEKRTPGRPAKTADLDDTPADAPPVVDDKTVTADHPKRAELKRIAGEYSKLTDVPSAQKAVKLYGENTNLVPDAELVGAIAHIAGLIEVKSAKKASADDII
jgi:hypothetical protein